MKRVLVTRPEPAASKTARRLEAMGFDAVILPLTRIVPAAVGVAGVDFDAVAATSANAVLHAPDDLIGQLSRLPAYAVGAKTAAAFRARGFARVEAGEDGGEALARRIIGSAVRPERVAYLCGRVRTPDFEACLREGHVGFVTIETYDTQPVLEDKAMFTAIFRSAPFDAILLYSAGSAHAIAALAKRNPQLTRFIGGTHFLCISAKVASALPEEWKALADFADEPTEEALFELLRLS
jgi:uroporphyrinogen-III synthase